MGLAPGAHCMKVIKQRCVHTDGKRWQSHLTNDHLLQIADNLGDRAHNLMHELQVRGFTLFGKICQN